jgi:hypothetical protein
MPIFPVPQFFRLIPLRGSWLRVKTKGNISFLFNLFLFCFISNSKLKFPFHLINYFKSELWRDFPNQISCFLDHLLKRHPTCIRVTATFDPFWRVFGFPSTFFGNLMILNFDLKTCYGYSLTVYDIRLYRICQNFSS